MKKFKLILKVTKLYEIRVQAETAEMANSIALEEAKSISLVEDESIALEEAEETMGALWEIIDCEEA